MTDLSNDNNQDDEPTCRICHCTESPGDGLVKLISPCHCSGSLRYVHHGCLQQWLDATNSQRCELCRHPFSMSIKYKPLYKWGSINASPSERRKLICNSVFNLVSMICIFWSIYVLIERAALDARAGQIDWNFYVKISVVTIGLIIGVIFLFVQLKLYFSIFMKWRQSNRIIIIRDANFSNTALTTPQIITVAPPTAATIPSSTAHTSSTTQANQESNRNESSPCNSVVCT
jgi:E3 ubiquitin-protein ligase MARCH1/8